MTNADLTYRLTGRVLPADYDAYLSACKEAFGADQYGWSVWEEEQAQAEFHGGADVADVVAEMNERFACRRANRNC